MKGTFSNHARGFFMLHLQYKIKENLSKSNRLSFI